MRSFIVLVAVLATIPAAVPAFAATADVPSVTVDASVAIGDSLPPIVQATVDLGPAPDSLPVRIVVSLDLHDKAGLDAFLAQVSDPASPIYQQFLTQDEFNARYAPTQAQEARVARWLTQAGFTITDLFPNHLLVGATGDNAAVQRAFGVKVHNVLYNGAQKHAAVEEPRFPADIAKFTLGVSGLDDLTQMHPMHEPLMPVVGNQPKAAVGASCCAFGPADLKVLYQNSAAFTGTGQTEVIAGAYTWKDTDVTSYDSQWGLPALPAGSAQVCAGSGAACAFDASNSIEVTLDVQMVHAVAPNAVIKNYMAQTTALTDFQTMYNKVVTDNPGHSVSTSWGSCETNSALSYQQAIDNIFANGNAIGQSWFAASGDSGAKDCGTTALVVDDPANVPHMMGVGGTHANCSPAMSSSAPNCAAYGSETSWTSGGGGVSNNFAKPSFQTGCSVPADGKRDVPDVSMESDTSPGNYVFYNGAWNTVGGTSDAAPMMGGVFALLNQKLGGSGQGLPGVRFYQLCGGNSFHDVTSGNNGGYNAGVGYDMNTGVGTMQIDNLLNNWQVATCSGTAPAAPTGLSATAGSGSVSLSWTDGSNGGCAINGHKIYRSTSSGTETLLTTSGTGTTYTDSGLTGGTTYFYKVTATNSVGESGLSNEASATPTVSCGTGPANNAFACPTNIASTPYSQSISTASATTETGEPTACGTATMGATVWYKWTAAGSGTATVSAVNASTTYDTTLAVYTGSALNGLTQVACNDDFSGTQSQLTFTCTAGTTYRIQLGGYNGATGTAGFWVAGCGAPPAPTVPGAPTLTATAGNGQVSLSWTQPSNGGATITSYKVYRGTTSGGEALLTTGGCSALGAVLSCTDSGLTNGQAYFYQVSAVNSVGEGARSTEKSATPSAGESTVYSESFDAGTATGWTTTAISGTNLWHLDNACVTAFSPAYTLAFTQSSPTCTYNTGARTAGRSDVSVSLAGKTVSAHLSFKHWFQVEQGAAGFDKMQVQYACNGGTTYTTLQTWDGGSTNPAAGSWLSQSYDVSACKGTSVGIRFVFDSVDSFNNGFKGWFVDNVVVTAQ